jgi:hypothetical protein
LFFFSFFHFSLSSTPYSYAVVATTATRAFPELVALLLYAGCRPDVVDNNDAQPQQYIRSDYSLKEVYDLFHYQVCRLFLFFLYSFFPFFFSMQKIVWKSFYLSFFSD